MVKSLTVLATAMLALNGCATSNNDNAIPKEATIVEASFTKSDDGFLLDGNNNIVQAGDGSCVQSSSWSENGLHPCGSNATVAEQIEVEAEPEPVVQLLPLPLPVSKPITQTLSGNAMFETGSASLSKQGMFALEELIAGMADAAPASAIEVVGHTDSTGSAAYNQLLSSKRAQSVRNYLQSRLGGLPVTATARGEDAPIADNSTADGRALNRRVEVVIKKKVFEQ